MRHIFTTAILTIVLGTNINAQDINENLLIHYPLNGDAIDESGNGYDGTVSATPAEDRFGNENGAMSFNGISEYIDLPNVLALKPELPISYSIWVKFDDIAPQKTTMFTNNFSQDNHSGVWLNGSSSGHLTVAYGSAMGNSDGSNIRYKKGTTDLQTDVWYHVVAIVRGATDMDLYINCDNENGTYHGSGTVLNYTEEAGSIGRKDVATVSPYYFDGSLDDFRYWDRALTENEIEVLCNNTLSVSSNEQTIDFTISPNPSSDYIKIAGENISHVQISDLTGKTILNTSEIGRIDISTFNPGLYIIRATTKEEQFGYRRLVVK